jgi:hypothetical protein
MHHVRIQEMSRLHIPLYIQAQRLSSIMSALPVMKLDGCMGALQINRAKVGFQVVSPRVGNQQRLLKEKNGRVFQRFAR